jgi:hypothetical protein
MQLSTTLANYQPPRQIRLLMEVLLLLPTILMSTVKLSAVTVKAVYYATPLTIIAAQMQSVTQ